jgi:hypothetical protein
MGALTENHRCPRRTLSRVTDALITVAIGAALGAVFTFAIDDRPAAALILAAAALGAVLASAVRQAIGGGRV